MKDNNNYHAQQFCKEDLIVQASLCLPRVGCMGKPGKSQHGESSDIVDTNLDKQ